ncbi:ogr/Delta-like zinc finger family protein [Pantoea vagans]|uniref:ogr/Delta-like zinc finger family protein n=1 Tax=Pantoea vagans TaxID=470934 RepID=UPI0009006520|nr:ogr/Delta-like zinc finger family protein [Pantoea vagans]AVE16798.1 late control protein B [Pantoea vagans]
MMRCPVCGHTSHTRTSRYISLTTKEAYYQCQDISCSCTFKTIESVDKIICNPRRNEENKKTHNEYI